MPCQKWIWPLSPKMVIMFPNKFYQPWTILHHTFPKGSLFWHIIHPTPLNSYLITTKTLQSCSCSVLNLHNYFPSKTSLKWSKDLPDCLVSPSLVNRIPMQRHCLWLSYHSCSVFAMVGKAFISKPLCLLDQDY